ncbi:uncharacterized protein BDR25DRAFT_317588 [Lindgomyces ingoldianus]|uniref:Uncharacterized protein n=1 Tax=Lindgomyces ingoldianus TaxID=673940 RepID=A0ACB6QKC9_9PLEO|nr:uncharacterized protein BDR25DRAFT_317588 [Lindgomyces ingoldianus]KAF2466595.1 hypothetical protein BDR25DRAFT_317588 [Lindgomyces ingoldianus]
MIIPLLKPLLLLTLFSHTLASLTPKSGSEHLLIADTGVGHRSRPVTTWRTSLRGLSTIGTNSLNLLNFGNPTPENQPIGSSGLAVDRENGHVYVATGEGIKRTDMLGGNNVTIVSESATSLAISQSKLYFGIQSTGLIKRANLNGTNVEVFLNVSTGLDYSYTPSYIPAKASPGGIAIDEKQGWIYWSSVTFPEDLSSIRRASFADVEKYGAQNVTAEVLVENSGYPGQMRVIWDGDEGVGRLYWVERARYTNSPTALKRCTFSPPRPSTPKPNGGYVYTPETIISSVTHPAMFFKTDGVDNMNMSITSFTVDNASGRLWFTAMSNIRVMWAKLVGMGIDGANATWTVLNENVTDIGIPVGVEYVP